MNEDPAVVWVATGTTLGVAMTRSRLEAFGTLLTVIGGQLADLRGVAAELRDTDNPIGQSIYEHVRELIESLENVAQAIGFDSKRVSGPSRYEYRFAGSCLVSGQTFSVEQTRMNSVHQN